MARRRSLCDYKLREVLPVLGAVVLVANLVGYIGGFILVDFNLQYTNGARRMKQQQQMLPTAAGYVGEVVSARINTIETTTNFLRPMYNNGARSVTHGQAGSANISLEGSSSVVQQSEKCSPTKSRSFNNGQWYNFSMPMFRFYAYSAWLDDRETIMSDPVIRIIAITTKLEDDGSGAEIELYCVLHYVNGIRYVQTERKPRMIGYGWPLNDEWVREYVYTCPLVEKQVPNSLAVVAAVGDSIPSCIPVEIPQKPASKQDCVVCVQVAFGKLDAYRIIEWLELQRLLGVNHVGVYTMDIDDRSMKVFQQYFHDEFIDLRKTDYIESGPQQYLLHGSPVINDCMYRNMHRFRYVVVIDFDETIMPQLDMDLLQLIDRLDRLQAAKNSTPTGNYIFQNNYFFTNLPPDTLESPYLTFLRYRMRAPLSKNGYTVKSIVDSGACVGMHNHYCWATTARYNSRPFPEVIDPSIGVNQHYKKCHLEEKECSELLANSTRDDSILKFRGKLRRQAEEKILLILGHNI